MDAKHLPAPLAPKLAAALDSKEALGQLLELFRPALLAWAGPALDPKLRGKEDAEDLVQETLLEAVRAFGEFQGASTEAFQAWLRRILERKLNDRSRHYRDTDKRQVAREVSLHADPGLPARLPSAIPPPPEQVTRSEEIQQVHEALDRLGEEERLIVLWHSYEDVPFEEIAHRLQRPPETARRMWWRVIELVRHELNRSA